MIREGTLLRVKQAQSLQGRYSYIKNKDVIVVRVVGCGSLICEIQTAGKRFGFSLQIGLADLKYFSKARKV